MLQNADVGFVIPLKESVSLWFYMYELQSDEHFKPRLKLEIVGDGPGSGRRTAVGTEDGGGGIDRSHLKKPPLWWRIFLYKRFRKYYIKRFSRLSIGTAMDVLRSAHVPQLYRVALAVRWGVIAHNEFSMEDLAVLLPGPPSLEAQLDAIEIRSTYRLWLTYDSEWFLTIKELPKFIQNFGACPDIDEYEVSKPLPDN